MGQDVARQFSFRLPPPLVERVDHCVSKLQDEGLEVRRADVVRMLLKYALDETQCEIPRLLGRSQGKRRTRTSAA